MSDPRQALVSRNPDIQGGHPCLRGTRFPVRTLVDGIAELGGIHGCRTAYHSLDVFTDEELAEAATYPLLPVIPITEGLPLSLHVWLDGDITVYSTDGDDWIPHSQIDAMIQALQEAKRAYAAWLAAADAWEEAHR